MADGQVNGKRVEVPTGILRTQVSHDAHGNVTLAFSEPTQRATMPQAMAMELGKIILRHAGAKKIEVE